MLEECAPPKNVGALSATDAKLVAVLRAAVPPRYRSTKYDTDFNLLRWARAYQNNTVEASAQLLRHLKLRRALQLDRLDQTLAHSELCSTYAPLGLVGRAGVGNKVLMYEFAGRVDLFGLMRSAQTTAFVLQRFAVMERVLSLMNEEEAGSGRQSGAVYIYDLEGLRMDSSMVSFVSGPFKILWVVIATNYPEFIHRVFVVNAPAAVSVLWAAFSPFVPAHTQKKIIIAGTDWREKLLDFVSADCLPEHFGGRLADEKAGLHLPPTTIPERLYWTPSADYPSLKNMSDAYVAAASRTLVGFYVEAADTEMRWFTHCSQEYTFAVYFTDDPKVSDFSGLEEVYTECEHPGLTSMDTSRLCCDRPGAYYLKFGNEKAWFLAVTVKYEARFFSPTGAPLDVPRLA